MELKKITAKALEVRSQYQKLEIKKYGRAWNDIEIAQGFVGDVGDLVKLVMAKNNLRDIENVDEKLNHELVDCFWSILVLADYYGLNLEQEFLANMDKLSERIKKEYEDRG